MGWLIPVAISLLSLHSPPLPCAPPIALEPGWPAIPKTLPQMVSFRFEVGTPPVSSDLLPSRICTLLGPLGPAGMNLGDLVWAYFALVYGVDLPMESFLPTLPAFLQGLLDNGVTVVPYPGQESLWARNLICLTFCSHVASALPGYPPELAYSVPMLVSLEVSYSGVRKFIQFFQVCNKGDEHSVIFPVPDGAACWTGKAATTTAY